MHRWADMRDEVHDSKRTGLDAHVLQSTAEPRLIISRACYAFFDHDRVLMNDSPLGWHNIASPPGHRRQCQPTAQAEQKKRHVHGLPRLCTRPCGNPRASASKASQSGLRDCSRRSCISPNAQTEAALCGLFRHCQMSAALAEAAADSRSTLRQDFCGLIRVSSFKGPTSGGNAFADKEPFFQAAFGFPATWKTCWLQITDRKQRAARMSDC